MSVSVFDDIHCSAERQEEREGDRKVNEEEERSKNLKKYCQFVTGPVKKG